MISESFIFVGVALALVSNLLYAVDTFLGRNKPNRVTWTLWSLIPLIAFMAQRDENVGSTALLTLALAIGPLLVLAASFYNKKSYWKVTQFDKVCGAVSVLALLVFLLTGSGLLALILSLVAEIFAALPTVKKAWKAPETESVVPFVIATIAALITLLTIQSWSFMEAAFAVYIFYINLLLAFLASRRKTADYNLQ